VYRWFDHFMPILARLEHDPTDARALDERDELGQEDLKQQGYGDRAELLLPAYIRTSVMYSRMEADRRMTAFGLNLWADALEGKPLSETPPLSPITGKPFPMERTEDRVTLRTGKREEGEWEGVMVINLWPAPGGATE